VVPEALDPRSYMAQSVPERMAIISAGVIMNLIFAFLMGSLAYWMGIEEMPCAISGVLPGEPAWRANMQPGDRVVEIDGRSADEKLRYRDLRSAVMFANTEEGVRFKIKREGKTEPEWIVIKPDQIHKTSRLLPTIGVLPAMDTQLYDKDPVREGTPASATGKFKGDDRVVSVGGVEVSDATQLQAELYKHSGEALKFVVQRTTEGNKAERVTIEVPPRPLKTLGLKMKIGKITAVQADSPASRAGLEPQDFIVSIDGESPNDLNPLTLFERFRNRSGETVHMEITRTGETGKEETLKKTVVMRDARGPVPVVGIAYKVLSVVHQVEAPASKATVTSEQGKPAPLAAGDEVSDAKFILPQDHDIKKEEREFFETPFEFSDEKPNWVTFMRTLQEVPPGTRVKLTLSGGRTAEIEPAESREWFNQDRGLVFKAELMLRKGDTVGEALRMGGQETKESSLLVYSFLDALVHRRMSWKNAGGPVTIFTQAAGAASLGVAQLLLFLTMLSTNLAVINFLPIPLLDGGHMVFLLLEGILRRPVSEKVVAAFHYLGFVFIISLMLFVLSLDFGLIPRNQEPISEKAQACLRERCAGSQLKITS